MYWLPHTRPRDLGTVLHLKGHLQERNCPQMRWKLTQPSTLLLLSRNCIVLCYLLENYEYKIKALSTHLHPLSHNLLKCFARRFLAKVMIKLPFFILWDCHDLKFWLVLGVDLPFRFQDPAMSECTASSAIQGRTWNDDPLQIPGDSVDVTWSRLEADFFCNESWRDMNVDRWIAYILQRRMKSSL
jgi:hypothetical protein